MEGVEFVMKLMLDTSTPICRVYIYDTDLKFKTEWEAGRGLAKGLLKFLDDTLKSQQKDWSDISGLAVMRGPGSFTGLRIGITVMNTLAYSNSVPIVGTMGEDWREVAMGRLSGGEDDKIVLPEYGGEANITAPRK